jgi:hypothetical protein
MSKVKGATHYPMKVINKLTSGGMTSSEANRKQDKEDRR